MGEFDDVIAEFLIESREGLEQLERDLVGLENTPENRELLARIFRCFHTIKGTSGFLGFGKLERLTHAGENLLSRMRDGELRSSAAICSALLETVDALRAMLRAVEVSGSDGELDYVALSETLQVLCRGELELQVESPRELARGRPITQPSPAQSRPPSPREPAPSRPAPPNKLPLASEELLLLRPLPSHRPPASARPRDDQVSARPSFFPTVSSPAPPATVSTRAAQPTSLEPAAPEVAATAAVSGTPPDRNAAQVPENVRVDLALLDRLVDLAGELVLTRNHILQLAKSREDADLASATQRLNFVTAQLQNGIMRMRMQPISNLFSRFPRIVRDLARSCRKLVRLELDGRDTELDKSLVETIKDPLVHLLRNCIDHGIEPPPVRVARGKHPEGRITLRAFHQNGLVHIEVSDDGAGIALDRVKQRALERNLISPERAARMSEAEIAALIFLPGFSTVDQVTSVSGRGVGTDVVKTNVEQVGGTVEVNTRSGLGTTFILKIPLTLAIVPALIVRSGEARYAVPQVNVIELVRLGNGKQTLEWIHGAPVFRLRGKLLPVLFLTELLGGFLPPTAANDSVPDDESVPTHFLAVVQGPGRQFGLVVDAVLDHQEIVVKPLPKLVADIGAFAGATLLGDGHVALILDVAGIAQRARLVSELREEAPLEPAGAHAAKDRGQRTFLLLQGPDDARLAVPLDEVSRLETIDVDSVESGGGHHVVQYRGEIMPLLRASELLPERRSRMRRAEYVPPSSKSLSVVVLGSAGRSVGLVVDDVLDVVETNVELRRLACRDGVVGTFVVQNRVTELLDLPWLMRAAGLTPSEERSLTG